MKIVVTDDMVRAAILANEPKANDDHIDLLCNLIGDEMRNAIKAALKVASKSGKRAESKRAYWASRTPEQRAEISRRMCEGRAAAKAARAEKAA